ncbi:MAG: lipopolysaccharide core heptose(I) kinase RfaP [Endozoicomonadaceae bacterium]|nr:lipopolysaccharide core heptose(I) kinase RfaP [Endozoicomonadaceae bacterium]
MYIDTKDYMLYLTEPFIQLWKDKNPFRVIEHIDGEIFRALEARKTVRFYLLGKGYFLKIHYGVGWLAIFGDLLRLRKPVLGAEDEYKAIRKLEQLSIATLSVAAYGKEHGNPARQQSFIITHELTQTISLEDFCMDWAVTPAPFKLKKELITQVAGISRKLHCNGVNHRDFYLCHFLLHIPKGKDNVKAESIKLWLIDLHRCQIRTATPRRWIIKDIAALWFSALNIGLTKRDLYRFIRVYTQMPLREAFTQYHWLWQPLRKKKLKIYARKLKKGDAI